MPPPPPSGSPILLSSCYFAIAGKMGLFYFEKCLKKVKKLLDNLIFCFKIYYNKTKLKSCFVKPFKLNKNYMQEIKSITLFDSDYETNIKINQFLQVTTISQNFYKNGKKKGLPSWDYKYYFFNDDLIYNDFIKQYQDIKIEYTKKNLAFFNQFVGGDEFILSRLNLTN